VCDFWNAVWADVREASGLPNAAAACELWSDVVRMRKAFAGRASAADTARFARLMELTYSSISRHTDADVVVDTSKHPGYFAAIRSSEVPLNLVLLTRDPRALAFSWSRPKADPDQPGGRMRVRRPSVVAAEWLALNLLGLRVGRSYGEFQRLRYEDIGEGGWAAAVASIVDLSRSDPNAAPVLFDHTVAGNPLRLEAGDREFRVDDRWVRQQARSDRLAATLVASPLIPYFGYRLRVDR